VGTPKWRPAGLSLALAFRIRRVPHHASFAAARRIPVGHDIDVSAALQQLAPLCETKVQQFSRRYRLHFHDREDLSQEFHKRLVERLPSFDPTKASLEAFAEVVLTNTGRDLKRKWRAKKRSGCLVVSLNDVVDQGDGEPIELASVIGRDEHEAQVGRHSRPEQEQTELRLDVREVVNQLDPDQRDLVIRFFTKRKSQVAHDTGISPSTIGDRLRKHRPLFKKGNLHEYLDNRPPSDDDPA